MPDSPATIPIEDDPGSLESQWIPAPDSSHLSGFRFVDRRNSRNGGPSEVWVKFGGKKGKPISTYKYLFYSYDEADKAFGELSSAGQPGKVTDAWKKSGVPCVGPL